MKRKSIVEKINELIRYVGGTLAILHHTSTNRWELNSYGKNTLFYTGLWNGVDKKIYSVTFKGLINKAYKIMQKDKELVKNVGKSNKGSEI